MKHLWIPLLLLLYMPNLGLSAATSVGTADIADQLIIPYWIAVRVAAAGRNSLRGKDTRTITVLLYGFVWWALLGVLAINIRYDYPNGNYTTLGLIKLAKFFIYIQAALDTRLLVANGRERDKARTLVILAATLLACGLLLFPEKLAFGKLQGQGYEGTNAMSVTLAIMTCFFGGIFAEGRYAGINRGFCLILLVVMIFGVLYSQGRGGVIALAVGISYLGITSGRPKHLFLLASLIVACTVAGYRYSPDFRELADATLHPGQRYVRETATLVGGVDDGYRIGIWKREGVKLVEAPLMGSGFFHRSPESGLGKNGSHNWFVQMLLETGIIGGLILSAVCLRLWSCASRRSPSRPNGSKALKSALVASFIGGLGGEYFSGGVGVFTVLLLVAVETGVVPSQDPSPVYQSRTHDGLAPSV